MLRLRHFAAIASAVMLLGTVPALGQDSSPGNLPDATMPSVEGIVDLAETDMPLGVGYLAPREDSGIQADWLAEVEIPLYVSPGGDHWGWIWQGWLIPNGQQAFAIGRDAIFTMVSVDSSLLAFPVLSVRDDGWLQVKYTDSGSAWVHQEHLTKRGLDLTFYPWGERLADAEILHLRGENEAQVLRSQPERGRNVLSLVNPNSLIEPLEIKDNWIRVRVTRPTDGCKPLAGSSQDEGWLQWQDSDGEVLMLPSREECAG